MRENIKEVVEKIYTKNLIRRIIIFIFALFLSSVVFNLFERPANIVTGGSTGISILTEHLFGIKPSDMILWISIASVILSFVFLGMEHTIGSIIATFVFPYFVDLTSNISSYIHVDMSDMLLISVFIGVLSGIVNGLIYKTGLNSGGTSVIFHILYKYYKISRTTVSLLFNGILVLLGGFYFGWTNVLYAIIILYIYSIVADKVLLGISKNKNVYIITNNEKDIKDYVLNDLKTGLTEIDVKGGLTFKKRKVYMTNVTNNQYFMLKEGVKHIDKKAFLIVTDSYHVSGGKNKE